jgi:hypothetical protein
LSLPSVNIPESVINIGNDVFTDYYLTLSLTSVNIPESVINIGNDVFTDFRSILKINFSTGCELLNSINVSDENKNYKSIDGVLFDKNGETLIRYPYARKGPYIIPENVTTIAAGAFKYSNGLTSVKIPESVTIIGESAFSDCLYLNSINIPENVTIIENYTFHNCRRLTSIHIHKNVSSIGDCAFYRCTSLKNINIPENHTFIEVNAFSECYRLPKIFYKTIKRNYGESRLQRHGPSGFIFEGLPFIFNFSFFVMSAGFYYYFTEEKTLNNIIYGNIFLILFILSLIINIWIHHKYKYDPSEDFN